MTILAGEGTAAISDGQDVAAYERRLYGKIAWHILPLVALGYIVNFLDRTNVSFAALTMNKDVGLSASEFGFGAGILFFSYCLFEVPSNIALYKFGARMWLARIMITWGLISGATIFVSGPYSYYVLRFLLGAAEAGYFPGVAFYFTLWFPKEYRARIFAWFLLAIPVSTSIGAPISTALLEMHGMLGLAGWKWMFLVEAAPALLIGVAMFIFMCDGPETASWLTEQEKSYVINRVATEPKHRERRRLLESLKDTRVVMMAAIEFCFLVGSYGIAIFMPLIFKTHGFGNIGIGWLTAVANIIACVGMMLWAKYVDRSGKPLLHLGMNCLVSGLGLILAIATQSFIPAYIGLTIALVGTNTARAVQWTIPTRFLTGIAAAGGLAMMNSIGTFGGFVGPWTMGFMRDLTGSYNGGLMAMSGFFFVGTALAWFMRRDMVKE